MDAKRLRFLPRLRARRRRGRRIQWQVHVRPVRAEGRELRDASRTQPRLLSQLLPAARAAGNSRGFALLATLDAQTRAFRDDVIAGLSAAHPRNPCALALRSARIGAVRRDHAAVRSYYPTRTETALFRRHHAGCGRCTSRQGSRGRRVRRRIGDQDPGPARGVTPSAYVPVDISGDYLEQSAAELQQRFPAIDVLPVIADFARPFTLPGGIDHLPKLGFFPGSTIGNFVPRSATDLLRQLPHASRHRFAAADRHGSGQTGRPPTRGL